MVYLTKAGTEIGVAATKTFCAQLLGLYFLTAVLTGKQHQQLLDELTHLPNLLQEVLSNGRSRLQEGDCIGC